MPGPAPGRSSSIAGREIVTVVVCTYNGEAYLRDQLESILAQTTTIDEILISDDRSSDGTLEIVASFAERDSRVTVLPGGPEQLGIVGNVSRAIAAARGDVIALSDQDDVWHAQKLETMAQVLRAHPEVRLVHSDARLIDAEGRPLPGSLAAATRMSPADRRCLMRPPRAIHALLRRNFVTGATVVVRSDLAMRALPVPDGWLHDEWFAIIAALEAATLFVPEALIDYRQHGSNQIGAAMLSAALVRDRMAVPRAERNRRLLLRTASLIERVAPDHPLMPLLIRKREHELRRSSLPVSRARRVPGVMRGALSGDYWRFGSGWPDVVRDLVQPA